MMGCDLGRVEKHIPISVRLSKGTGKRGLDDVSTVPCTGQDSNGYQTNQAQGKDGHWAVNGWIQALGPFLYLGGKWIRVGFGP